MKALVMNFTQPTGRVSAAAHEPAQFLTFVLAGEMFAIDVSPP